MCFFCLSPGFVGLIHLSFAAVTEKMSQASRKVTLSLYLILCLHLFLKTTATKMQTLLSVGYVLVGTHGFLWIFFYLEHFLLWLAVKKQKLEENDQ